jgi:diacylglycerol kinase (ATP)
MTSRIPVIINPASGQKKAVLADINRVFRPAGIRWSVEITQNEGDATHLARRLAEQGAEIVAVYGGDGTISEVACGLAGTQAALAILPGGTGNVLTFEFGIPRDIVQAARLLVSHHRVRLVDMGEVDGRKFLLRAGAGLEAATIQRAPREFKDRFGLLAYTIAALQSLMDAHPVQYKLELDGQTVETQGILCTVANAGHLGLVQGLSLAPSVTVEDGLLDVIVMNKIDPVTIIALLSGGTRSANIDQTMDHNGASRGTSLGSVQHWQVKRARIQADPPQATQVDGDNLGTTPMQVSSIPQALRVVVPG